MTFEQMLRRAKGGDQEAVTSILLMYRPLLLKYAVINGRLDEDLYQELCITLMRASLSSRYFPKSAALWNLPSRLW